MAFTISGDEFSRMDLNNQLALANKDLMNKRRALREVAEQDDTVRGVGLTRPEGAISSMVNINQAPREGVTPAGVDVGMDGIPDEDLPEDKLPSRVGLTGSPGITQIDPDAPYPKEFLQRLNAGQQFDQSMQNIRNRIIPVPLRFSTDSTFSNPLSALSTGANELRRYGERFPAVSVWIKKKPCTGFMGGICSVEAVV